MGRGATAVDRALAGVRRIAIACRESVSTQASIKKDTVDRIDKGISRQFT
jgi:hypothetical protein